MKTYKFTINGKEYTVDVNGIEGKNARVSVNGVAYDVELESEPAASVQPAPAIQTQAAAPVREDSPAAAPEAPAAPSSGAARTINSPLPGVIISIDVKEGESVKKGQKLAVLEAMKMENEIQSDADGTVSAILVKQGDSVLEGAAILKIS